MNRLRRFTPALVAAVFVVGLGLQIGVPIAWWLSLRSEVALSSPTGRHSIRLTGRFGRPVFAVNHTVYATVFDGTNPVVSGREIHTGDWMDPWFDLWYPRRIWVNDNILRLTSPHNEALKEYDQIAVRNSASQTVSFLRIDCRDMFLLLDITPGQVMFLKAPRQGESSWLEVEGQFADMRDVQAIGKNARVFDNRASYSIDIRDDRVDVTLEAIKLTDGETTPPKN